MPIENTDATNVAEETVSVENVKPSIEETARKGYQELMAKGGLDEGEGGEEATTEPQDGRARGPDGKFLPKAKASESPAVAAETPAEEGGEQAVAEEDVTGTPVVAKPHDTPPNTWRKEIAADFAKLPENVREEIHRREADFHKGIGQYKQAAGFGTEMAQELLPYQQTMQQFGKHPREVVKEATAVWNTLVRGSPQEKMNLWLQVAKDYDINLKSLDQTAQQSEGPAVQEDPRLATALQRLEKLEGTLTSQERQRAQAEYSQNVETVQKFGADPKNKHFNAVREDMAALIESGRATDLQDAYDKAIWSNPEVRKALLAEQDKARADKAAQDAAAARKAAGANVARRGTPPVAPKLGSIEDTLRSGLRRLNGA